MPPMSEPPDLAELARRYADLWQEYLADLAQDEAAARAFAALFAGKAMRAELEELAAMERLSPKLRERALAKLG